MLVNKQLDYLESSISYLIIAVKEQVISKYLIKMIFKTITGYLIAKFFSRAIKLETAKGAANLVRKAAKRILCYLL